MGPLKLTCFQEREVFNVNTFYLQRHLRSILMLYSVYAILYNSKELQNEYNIKLAILSSKEIIETYTIF